jgi:hypothetical protein
MSLQINFARTIASFALLMAFSASAYASRSEEFSLTAGSFSHSVRLDIASIFSIANQSGDIQVKPIAGDQIRLSGSYRGAQPSKLIFEEIEPGKVKIKVESPNGGGGMNGDITNTIILGEGNNVRVIQNVGNVGRGVTIVGAAISVDGTVTIGGSSGSSTQLVVEIPSELLLHLRAETEQGSVEFLGFDETANTRGRQVSLESRQGELTISNSTASGGFKAETRQGSVTAHGNRGRLDLTTRQGSIDARDNIGDIAAGTRQGSVSIEGQQGHVVAETRMGNIRLNNPQSLSEKAETRMGKVTGLRQTQKCERDITNNSPFNF